MEDFGLSAMEVHEAIYQDRFRDACSHGDIKVMTSIMSKMSTTEEQELIHKATHPYGSPFFEAILTGSNEALKLLIGLGYQLEQEYDVCIFDPIAFDDKCAALCLACACGNKEIVELLLSSGSLVNHVSAKGSPIFYANEFNDPALINLLLLSGGFHNETTRIPFFLQEACMLGHMEKAEMFMQYSKDVLSDEKKICFLGMLGAQCINLSEDYTAGVKYWKQALNLLANISNKLDSNMIFDKKNDVTNDLKVIFTDSRLLQGVPVKYGGVMFKDGFVSEADEMRLKQRGEVFGNMQLCTSLQELEAFADDKKCLCLQALIVLQAILSPTDQNTLRQVPRTANVFVQLGDVESACLLLLHTIEALNFEENLEVVSEFSAVLCEIMLNCFVDDTSRLSLDHSKVKNIIITATEFLVQSMIIIQEKMFPKDDDLILNNRSYSLVDPRYYILSESLPRNYFKIGMFTQMVETFMGFMALLVKVKNLEQEQHEHPPVEVPNRSDINNNDDYHNGDLFEEPSALNQMKSRISTLLSLCHRTTAPFSKFNFESEMLKIAVHGDLFAMSTLDLFQNEFFPNIEVLDFLVSCGASVNCFDFRGSTSLHHSIDCSQPDINIIQMLLNFGADIDARNREGITSYELLSSMPDLPIYPFNYTTLKCLSALAIVKHHVNFNGELPKILENFVAFHSMPIDCQRKPKIKCNIAS